MILIKILIFKEYHQRADVDLQQYGGVYYVV